DSVVKPTSILGGPFETTLRISRYVLESVLVGLGPLALAVFLVPWYVRRYGWGRAEWFLVGWTVPPIVVYTLVHFGQAGYVLTFVGAIRGLYAPDETAVVTELGNPRSYPWLRHAMFYLPEYPIYELTVGELPAGFYAPRMAQVMARVPESHIALPAGVKQLVWFVDHWSPLTERPLGLTEIELPHGRYLYLLSIGRKPVDYAGYTFVREN